MNVDPIYLAKCKKTFYETRQSFRDEPLIVKQLPNTQYQPSVQKIFNYEKLPTIQLELFKKRFVENYRKTHESNDKNLMIMMDVDDSIFKKSTNYDDMKSRLQDKFKKERSNYLNQSKRVESKLVIDASCDCYNFKSSC